MGERVRGAKKGAATAAPPPTPWARAFASIEGELRDPRESIMDELNIKRASKKVAAAFEQAERIAESDPVADFGKWMVENMGEPAVGITRMANSVVGTLQGTLIGTWFDAGATPELLKEYLSRFVDMTWQQYQAAMRKT